MLDGAEPAVVSGLGWPTRLGSSPTPVGWLRTAPALPASAPPTHQDAPVSRETEPVPAALTRDPDVAPERRAHQGTERLSAPERTRVLVVANQKGGVGKTTSAVNIAAGLAQLGLRVLVVDLDPQGNASTALAVEHSEGTPGIYQVLIGDLALSDVVVPCAEVDRLMVAPATIDLAGAEIELVSMVARENRLRGALTRYLTEEESAGRRFDYVFLDCPPSLGLLTVNALTAGQEMLIPIQCEYYALEGVTQLMRTIDQVCLHLNQELRIGAVVLTMYDARTKLSSGVADEVRAHFGDLVLPTPIPRSVRISEAPSYGQTVLTYDPTSTGARSYLDAARQLAAQQVRS